MKDIINQTEIMADAYFKGFGFDDDQINTLVTQGKKDISKEVSKLETLLENSSGALVEINNALHALKGLFSQLGNHKVAEQLREIEKDEDAKVRLEEISQLLFHAK